jgi:hypothetical protein
MPKLVRGDVFDIVGSWGVGFQAGNLGAFKSSQPSVAFL